MTHREGETILLRATVESVGPDGWMTVVLPIDEARDQRIIINERDPAIEPRAIEAMLMSSGDA